MSFGGVHILFSINMAKKFPAVFRRSWTNLQTLYPGGFSGGSNDEENEVVVRGK